MEHEEQKDPVVHVCVLHHINSRLIRKGQQKTLVVKEEKTYDAEAF